MSKSVLILIITLIWLSNSKIYITSPKSLQNEIGIIDNGIANFGVVPYGHSVMGNIMSTSIHCKLFMIIDG